MPEQDSKVEELQKSLIVAIRLAKDLEDPLTALKLLGALEAVTKKDELQSLIEENAQNKKSPLKTQKLDKEILEGLRVLSGAKTLQEYFKEAVEKSLSLASDVGNSAAISILTQTAEQKPFVKDNNPNR